MPQLNSEDAANDEPTAYNVEDCEDDQRWHENLNDIKVDLVGDLDRDSRSANNSKSQGHGEPSNKDRLERDPRDEIKGPGRPNLFYPPDIGSIVSGLHPNMFANGGLPPNSKVSYPYPVPYHALLYGHSPSSDMDSKPGMPRHHPDIPNMYSLPGQLGQIPHPLAPWPAAPIYPICTASTVAMASMLRTYPNPFAAFTSSAAAAAVASNMPRFPLGPPHPHGPGMHPTMIPHPALVSNGPLSNMNGQHPHHVKHDQDKPGSRHSKSESEHGGRSKRDRPYVKKPLNAFMLYMKEQRAKVVAECTLKESAAINQILGRKWHSLSREEQQKYYEMARKERQLHLQLYPGWSARDNYGKRKKRKKEKSQGECTAQNPKKCRAVFGLEQQQLWCAPCRRKKKCIRYQHDDDSDDDDLSPVQSPQYQNFGNQPNPFDVVRSSSPLSITSQSTNVTNGNGDYGPSTSSASRLPGTQISPMQPGMIHNIKEEFRTSPVGMEGHHNMTNGSGNFDPYTNRHPGRAPSSDNSFKSEGSPNSQGGDSGIGHRRSNDNSNNNNGKELMNRRGEGECGRGISNGNPPQNAIHRQASAPSGGESRGNFRKTNSLDGSDMPGTSGLTGRGGPLPHNTSAHSNVSDSPGSSNSRTQHSQRNSLGSLNKMPGGSGNPSLPHPSPQHPPSTGLFLPPHSPSYNHASPHGATFMPPYFPPGMLAAFGGTPPSPLSSLMFSSFRGISPSGMGGPNPGSSSHNQARMTPGAVVEGKS